MSPVLDAGLTPLFCALLRNLQVAHPAPPAAAAWPETVFRRPAPAAATCHYNHPRPLFPR